MASVKPAGTLTPHQSMMPITSITGRLPFINGRSVFAEIEKSNWPALPVSRCSAMPSVCPASTCLVSLILRLTVLLGSIAARPITSPRNGLLSLGSQTATNPRSGAVTSATETCPSTARWKSARMLAFAVRGSHLRAIAAAAFHFGVLRPTTALALPFSLLPRVPTLA